MNSGFEPPEAAGEADPLNGFSPLLQAPARLQIMALLSHVQDAEFQRLRDVTGCSDSLMSKHLSALAEAGLIRVHKAPLDGRSRTWATMTRSGRTTFAAHVGALRIIISGGEPGAMV